MRPGTSGKVKDPGTLGKVDPGTFGKIDPGTLSDPGTI